MTRTHVDGSREDVDLVYKLFHDIAPRFLERLKEDKAGGYTRITKLRNRKGDNALISVIEFIDRPQAAAAEPAEEASAE